MKIGKYVVSINWPVRVSNPEKTAAQIDDAFRQLMAELAVARQSK